MRPKMFWVLYQWILTHALSLCDVILQHKLALLINFSIDTLIQKFISAWIPWVLANCYKPLGCRYLLIVPLAQKQIYIAFINDTLKNCCVTKCGGTCWIKPLASCLIDLRQFIHGRWPWYMVEISTWFDAIFLQQGHHHRQLKFCLKICR